MNTIATHTWLEHGIKSLSDIRHMRDFTDNHRIYIYHARLCRGDRLKHRGRSHGRNLHGALVLGDMRSEGKCPSFVSSATEFSPYLLSNALKRASPTLTHGVVSYVLPRIFHLTETISTYQLRGWLIYILERITAIQ